MDSQLVPVALVVIAASSLVHAGALIWLAVQARRVARRVDELQRRVERELAPNVARLSQVTENLQEISEIARTEATRIEGVVQDTARKVQETTDVLRDAVVKPLEPLVHIAAFVKGIRRGVEVYRRLRGFERERRSEASREDDEHLFI